MIEDGLSVILELGFDRLQAFVKIILRKSKGVHGFGDLVGDCVGQAVAEGQVNVGFASLFFEGQTALTFDLFGFALVMDAMPFDALIFDLLGGLSVKLDLGSERTANDPVTGVVTGALDRFDTANEFGKILEVLPELVDLSNGRFNRDGFINRNHFGSPVFAEIIVKLERPPFTRGSVPCQ